MIITDRIIIIEMAPSRFSSRLRPIAIPIMFCELFIMI